MTSRNPIDHAPQQPMVAPSPGPQISFPNRPWLLALLLVTVTFAAYFPALHAGFVWDDALIVKNPLVKASDGLHRFWFTTQAPDYYPLTWSLWWAEWRLWGLNATGYHVLNVLLHAANAVLVWMVLRRLKVPGAWLAACIFAIHPVNVATVAWVSEQKNTLSLLLYLTAILLYLRFDDAGRRRWYGLSLLAFLLALLTKTAVVMLPVVLLGCTWWQHGRIRGKDWLRVMPFFVLALVLGLVTVWFQYHRVLGVYRLRTDSFLARLAAAGWVPWFYLYKDLYPSNLGAIYPKWQIDASRWVSYVPGFVLAGCLTLFWSKRRTWGRSPLFGLGYFVVTLFPVLGFFDQGLYGASLVADHWQYCSIIGIIALTVAAGVAFCRRLGPPRRYVGVLAGALVVGALGTATWTRSHVYNDSQTLWANTLLEDPNAWLAQNNLGVALKDQGQLPEAIAHFEEALRIKPDFADAHYNWGVILAQTGKTKEAIAHYEQALRIKPDYADAHNNLGFVLAQTGKTKEAIAHYEQALRIKPDFAEAYNNLGNVLLSQGNVPEAVAHFEKALALDPDLAEAHNNLGNVLLREDKTEEAIVQYEQALKIKPDYAEVHYNLAVALYPTGKRDEAIEHYQQALRLKPDFAIGQNTLALALARQGRTQEAMEHWEQALQIKPDYTEALRSLGTALEHAGRIQEAIAQYEQALRTKPDYPEALNDLAWLLATREPAEGGDPTRAVALAQQACQLTDYRVAWYLDTLAAAYAAASRFSDATATAEQALELASAGGQPRMAEEIECRLKLYRDGRPYHEASDATNPSPAN